jgi:hypothetical protein
MADLTVTAANVGLTYPEKAASFVYSHPCAVAITAGQVCFLNTSGALALADGSAAGTALPHFIALESGGAGEVIRVAEEAIVSGFTISQDIGDTLYVSDTGGALADAAGTAEAIAGRVTCASDGTKLVHFKGGNL